MGNTEKAAKTWGKKEWVFLVSALLVIALLWNLIPYVYGLVAGRRAYEKVMNFQPSEETCITVQMFTVLPDGHSTGGDSIKITDLEQQKEITALISQLEHNGHYTLWGYMPFQKNRLDPPWYGYGNQYTIVLRPTKVNEHGHIDIASDRCMGGGNSNQYPPKYDNYEALFQYCETIFEDAEIAH